MYSGLGAYYLKNGQVASVLYVGDTMGFNVPGYQKIWLDQAQNGTTQFSGPFNLPMAPYILQDRDRGTFQATVYELTPGGTKGKVIGSDSIQVLAAVAPVQQTFAPPVIQAVQAPGYTNPVTTPGGTPILATGVATPSAPAPAQMLFSPSASYAPGPEAPAAAETPAAAEGFPMGLLVIAGLGLLFLFSGRRGK